MSMCAHVTVHVCRIAQLTQRHFFLYDSQLCGLGALFGHSTAKNVWCATLLESPSYPHTLTLNTHTHTHTHTHSIYRDILLLWAGADTGKGLTPKGRTVQIPQLIEKTQSSEGKVEELMSTFVTPSPHPPHFHHASIVVDEGGVFRLLSEKPVFFPCFGQ